MPVFFLHHLLSRGNKPEEQQLVKLHEPQYSTNEGSEFLDDAIRSEDLEPASAEERIASGSPE